MAGFAGESVCFESVRFREKASLSTDSVSPKTVTMVLFRNAIVVFTGGLKDF